MCCQEMSLDHNERFQMFVLKTEGKYFCKYLHSSLFKSGILWVTGGIMHTSHTHSPGWTNRWLKTLIEHTLKRHEPGIQFGSTGSLSKEAKATYRWTLYKIWMGFCRILIGDSSVTSVMIERLLLTGGRQSHTHTHLELAVLAVDNRRQQRQQILHACSHPHSAIHSIPLTPTHQVIVLDGKALCIWWQPWTLNGEWVWWDLRSFLPPPPQSCKQKLCKSTNQHPLYLYCYMNNIHGTTQTHTEDRSGSLPSITTRP